MPYPAQVDKAAIVERAQQLLETEGLEALSLAKLAEALGVKAPSLYRHVGHKVELLRAVNGMTVEALFAAMHDARSHAPPEPYLQLLAVFHAFRRFAHAHPQSYALLFSQQTAGERPDENHLVGLALSLQSLIAQISGEANALAALRGALALAHGYVMLELNQQLRRGGDLEVTYEQVITAYLRGWSLASTVHDTPEVPRSHPLA